jgi:hypothetical protein
MSSLIVEISRYVNDDFPGWVECALVDAFSQRHVFLEKVPVVTGEHLGPESAYPQLGAIACEVEAQWLDVSGRNLLRVNTERPWGIESAACATRFVVVESQLRSDEHA